MLKPHQLSDDKRNKKIYQLREKGLSFADIAKMYDISRERVRQLHERRSKELAILQALDK